MLENQSHFLHIPIRLFIYGFSEYEIKYTQISIKSGLSKIRSVKLQSYAFKVVSHFLEGKLTCFMFEKYLLYLVKNSPLMGVLKPIKRYDVPLAKILYDLL